MIVTPISKPFGKIKPGDPWNLKDKVAGALILRGLVRKVETPEAIEEVEAQEISPRTGRPKRQYRRRDMVAEQ
jgi:hypothetical protein